MNFIYKQDAECLLDSAESLNAKYNDLSYHTTIELLSLNKSATKGSWEYGFFCGWFFVFEAHHKRKPKPTEQILLSSNIQDFKTEIRSLSDNDKEVHDYYDNICKDRRCNGSWELGFFQGGEEYIKMYLIALYEDEYFDGWLKKNRRIYLSGKKSVKAKNKQKPITTKDKDAVITVRVKDTNYSVNVEKNIVRDFIELITEQGAVDIDVHKSGDFMKVCWKC